MDLPAQWRLQGGVRHGRLRAMTRLHGYRGGGLMGHNRGPGLNDPGFSGRRFAWAKARQELLGTRLPIEVLRRRVARARELGLAYPAYASILLGSGRDILGFLYTCDALGVRLARELEVPAPVKARLSDLKRCDRMIVAPEAENPEEFRIELQAAAAVPFSAATPSPREGCSWAEARAAVTEMLRETSLHRGSVVMIGTREAQADWAEAGGLARFMPAESYWGAARATP